MTDDQLLEGVCECGEKGTLGEVCDICGGVFTESGASFDDFDDDDENYPKDLMKKDSDGAGDVLPLEAADGAVVEDDEY